MSEPADQDDLTALLVRAFGRAWERYYLPDRAGTISEEIARHSLAKHLVAMVNDGVKEEVALAAGGLLHLISLTPAEIIEEAVVKSNRRPQASEVVSEFTAFVHERDQPRTLVDVASRFATAMGVSAIVAFVFFVLVPKSQKSDAAELAVRRHRTLPLAEAAESQALLEKFVQWQHRQ